ncbi:MAG: hypothetical protein II133_03185 [Lachnospiraceae bacterium]|nr:hypothetical protein [Lachnospiraceae bacterium]
MKKLSRRTIITIAIAAALVAVIVIAAVWSSVRSYDNYDIEDSFSIDGAQTLSFLPFAGGLLSYSRDGAQYYDSSGLTIWNESYNMQSPVVKTCDKRLIVYDRQGSSVVVMSETKELSVISTNHTIVMASVASDGTVAVLTQEGDTGYINLYSDDGKSVAGGQVHLSQTGYPMSLALSDDGQRLIVSFEYAASTRLSTRINIYDFSSAGDRKKDNIIASFEYEDTVCPQVEFFSDGRAYAFTDSGARIYSSGNTVKESTAVKVKYDISAVVSGDDGFGLIHRDADNRRILAVYSEDGKRIFSKKLRSSYESSSLIGNGQVMIKSGKCIEIFGKNGQERFSYRFPDEVEAFVPAEDPREFFLVQRDSTEIIRVS